MGQAFDRDGKVLGEASGEVNEKEELLGESHNDILRDKR